MPYKPLLVDMGVLHQAVNVGAKDPQTVFKSMIGRVSREVAATHVIFCGDTKPTARLELLPEYKSDRENRDDTDINAVRKALIAWFDKQGLRYVTAEGHEADDVIAAVIHDLEDRAPVGSMPGIVIYSRDHDLLCLVQQRPVRRIMYDGKIEWDADAVYEKYGVRPTQLPEFFALVGGKSKIPGVKGIGQKYAKEVLTAYPSVHDALENPWKLTEKQRDALQAGVDQFLLSLRVVRLRADLPISFDFDSTTDRLDEMLG